MNLTSRFLREMHFPILLISFLTPKLVKESPLLIKMNGEFSMKKGPLDDDTKSFEIFHHLEGLSEALDAGVPKLRASKGRNLKIMEKEASILSEMDAEPTEVLHFGHIFGDSRDNLFISLFTDIKATRSFFGADSKSTHHLLSFNFSSKKIEGLVLKDTVPDG